MKDHACVYALSTRLTDAFSTKVQNLEASGALRLANYRLVKLHKSLCITPAMATGVSDRLWSFDELVQRTSYEADMGTIFLDLELHTPDIRSTVGGGWIVPKSWSTNKNGLILLTPHCAGLGEIEWHIDRLQADLEELRKTARKTFAKFSAMPRKLPSDSN